MFEPIFYVVFFGINVETVPRTYYLHKIYFKVGL